MAQEWKEGSFPRSLDFVLVLGPQEHFKLKFQIPKSHMQVAVLQRLQLAHLWFEMSSV